MKDLRPALRAFLLGDSAINTLVGGQRIYAGILPQNQKLASVVQNLVTEDTDYHMQGASGLGISRMQIDCWGDNPDAAVVLANLVFDRLSGHRGEIAYGSNSPQDEVDVRGIFHDQGRDDYDDVAKLHRRSRDYIIWYSLT